jgi:hypothetical protein
VPGCRKILPRARHGTRCWQARNRIEIQQEYWCSFNAAVFGAFWGKEMNAAEREGRICDLPIDRAYPVYTWDGL